MTKIFLHGGSSSKNTEKNKRFFEDLIKSVNKEEIKILCIYFARPEHRWEDSYAEDQSIFYARGIEMGKEIETKMATYDMEDFREYIKNADVVYINGGMKGHLKSTLEKLGNFREMIAGKTLVGISAGANILCKYYYSMVSEDIREGIGLLNYKLLTHYSGEIMDGDKVKSLENYKEKIPLIKIPEEEYKIIEMTD